MKNSYLSPLPLAVASYRVEVAFSRLGPRCSSLLKKKREIAKRKLAQY
jgi:hypothetical protein